MSFGYSMRSSGSVRQVRSSGIPARSMSVHGVGYGGSRIASVGYSSSLGSSAFGASSLSASSGVSSNEKATMQNLNDRLASYLDRVRDLETSNSKMELEIRQFYENATPAAKDWSAYWAAISGLRQQINDFILDNSRLMLQIDNSKLAAEDFKSKFEAELGIRLAVEGDINGLRGMLDEMTLDKSQLEMQIEGLKEELIYIRKNHEEALRGLRGQISGNVTVDVTAEKGPDLSKALNEMRQQYEEIVRKNKAEAEEWYAQQCVIVQQEFTVNTDAIQAEKSQLTQVRHTVQGLEMELQSLLSMIASLEGSLGEVEGRYSDKRNMLQMDINRLEGELMDLRLKLEQSVKSYAELLDVKTKLEMEIATYRALLNGSGQVRTSQTTKELSKTVVVKEEKHEPVITKTVRTVVEESINGQVVSKYTEDINVK